MKKTKRTKKTQTKSAKLQLKELSDVHPDGSVTFVVEGEDTQINTILQAAIIDGQAKKLTVSDLLYQAFNDVTISLRTALIGAFIKKSLEEFCKDYDENPHSKKAEKKLQQKLAQATEYRRTKAKTKRKKIV